MNISLDNNINATGLVTFSHIPTIVNVESEMSVGQKAKCAITVCGNSNVSADTDYYITINDTKIYGTLLLEKALNTTFYISQLSGQYYNASMAYYLLKALSNTNLINNYNIYIDKQTNLNSNIVVIEAKAYGSQYDIAFDTNLPTSVCTKSITGGSNNDSLNGSKVLMDIYIATQDDEMSTVGEPTGEEQTVPDKPAETEPVIMGEPADSAITNTASLNANSWYIYSDKLTKYIGTVDDAKYYFGVIKTTKNFVKVTDENGNTGYTATNIWFDKSGKVNFPNGGFCYDDGRLLFLFSDSTYTSLMNAGTSWTFRGYDSETSYNTYSVSLVINASINDWISQTSGDYTFAVKQTAYQVAGYADAQYEVPIKSLKGTSATSFRFVAKPSWILPYIDTEYGYVLLITRANSSGKVQTGSLVLVQDESKLQYVITLTQDLPSSSSSKRRKPRKIVVPVSTAGDELPSNSLAGQLEKNYIKNGIKFDIAPLLANYIDYGKIIQYNIVMSYIKDGLYRPIGSIKNNYAVGGYLVNGSKYLDMNNGNIVAQDMHNGEEKAFLNNTVLLYSDIIRFSMLFYSLDPIEVLMTYRNSAGDTVYTATTEYTPTAILETMEFEPEDFNNVAYIDITVGETGTIRYTNIKPLKYGNTNNILNLFFTNSYGGTSFLPFTASRTDEYDVDSEVYQPSTFSLYSSTEIAKEKVFSREVEKTVTLKTCYFTEDAKYTFEDLNASYNVWYEDDNDIRHMIVIDDVSIDEVQTGIYQATVAFKEKLI